MRIPELLGHEAGHVILTIFVVVAIWLIYGNIENKSKHLFKIYLLIVVGAVIGGILLDLDHLVDYVLAFGLNFNLKLFLSSAMFAKSHKSYIPLHGWEWVVSLSIITVYVPNRHIRYFLMALTLSMIFHLLYDMAYYHFYFLGYSLIYRIIHNFSEYYLSNPSF